MEIKQIAISNLKKAEYNPRKISADEMRKLKRSITEFGFIDPIIANGHEGRENVIIGGHQRVAAAEELGYKDVPVIYVDLPEEKEKILGMALNRISGDWDETKLVELLEKLDDKNADLTLTGFSDNEIDKLLEPYREGKEEIPLPEKVQARAKPGDIWQLGDHRIMCGDCTILENYQHLLGNELVDMVLTDPPYNLGYIYNSYKDNLSSEQYETFCKKWFCSVKPITDKILITCGPQNLAMWCAIEKPKWVLAWFKKNAQSGCALRGLNRWEPIILYGRFEPVLFYGCVDKIIPWDTIESTEFNKTDDVYDVRTAFLEDSGEPNAAMHSCPKPTKLFAKLIKDFTRTNNVVLDIFLGSGTALIACEKTKRICRGLELDPHYVDVALTRWEQFTGRRAKLLVNVGTEWQKAAEN